MVEGYPSSRVFVFQSTNGSVVVICDSHSPQYVYQKIWFLAKTDIIRDVQENYLRLLYRLLFIFYAESRKLLNTDNKHYKEMSLRKLKEEIASRRD